MSSPQCALTASVLHPLGEKRIICVTYISGVLPRGFEKKLLKDGRRIVSLYVERSLTKNSHATTGDPRLESRDANISCGSFLSSLFPVFFPVFRQLEEASRQVTHGRESVCSELYRMRVLSLTFFLSTALAVEAATPRHVMSGWILGAALASGIWYFLILLVQAIGFIQL